MVMEIVHNQGKEIQRLREDFRMLHLALTEMVCLQGMDFTHPLSLGSLVDKDGEMVQQCNQENHTSNCSQNHVNTELTL
jgi:hypothetical protein